MFFNTTKTFKNLLNQSGIKFDVGFDENVAITKWNVIPDCRIEMTMENLSFYYWPQNSVHRYPTPGQ